MTVRVDAAAGSVRLAAGAVQTVPIYIAATSTAVRFSWDLHDLVNAGCVEDLDCRAARDYVQGQHRYSHRTMFQPIMQLTERMEIRFENGITQALFPEPALSLRPKKVRNDRDVVTAYIDLMVHTVRTRSRESVVCELSGGFDSSNVTLAASTAYGAGARSYGVIFAGSPGAVHQVARRNAVIAVGALSDAALLLGETRFLRQWVDGPEWINPYDEIYERIIAEAATRAELVGQGYTVMTGIGGDECMLPTGAPPAAVPNRLAAQSEAVAPKTVIPETALLACNARAPMFLRLGMLPFNPYCEPEVVAFSERLPDDWKTARRLQRAAMQQFGVSEHALARPHPENFEAALRSELMLVEGELRKSLRGIVVAEGIVTPEVWRWAFANDFRLRPIKQLSVSVRLAILERSLMGLFGE